MFYKSTRNSSVRVESAVAIAKGISEEGGLFVPESIPMLSMDELRALLGKTYAQRAAYIFSKYLTDFTESELRYCTERAYTTKAFDTENIAELAHLFDGTYMLELWHGPTCAFKDMALQILPYFLTTAVKKLSLEKKVVILVATSGDTGKAALEGFKDVSGTEILVFYPEEGVSDMQKRQMTTQEGENVAVCAVKGNFDDCQNGVKQIFTDKDVLAIMEQGGFAFSSANSINWGRLVPQIVYYVSVYVTLTEDGELNYGDQLNVVVPTGNFGNILAAYYAKQMGVPIGKLICASNVNKVLTDFIRTGIYDRNRDFHATISPSMDILISSNLERLLYLLADEDDAQIQKWFGLLASTGCYEVTDAVKEKLTELFYGGFCDDTETKETIGKLYQEYGYTCDTHTAVAVKVYQDYRKETGDITKTLIVSTASPFKFSGSVLEAIGAESGETDEYAKVEQLKQASGLKIPQSLAALQQKPRRFTDSIEKTEMRQFALKKLHLS